MTTESPDLDCSALIGLDESGLVARLGPPTTRRRIGADLWLIHTAADVSLRVRCATVAGGSPRVSSWTATFRDGYPALAGAARALGLWPVAAPDEDAAAVSAPLIRRPLDGPDGDATGSLTATVRGGRFTQISVFDEAPDWR